MRQEFPRAVKAKAFARAGGQCEGCTARLVPGKFAYDHDLPDGLGGGPTLANCKVLCDACHDAKTAGRDVPTIAKMKRQRDSHIGARTATRKLQSRGFTPAAPQRRASRPLNKWRGDTDAPE